MLKLKSYELRKKYLDFFKSKNHAIIQSASLIPENDPTVLFTTAGMHPLVPYLTGQKHPLGKRLADVQKCVRTGDIEEVGDATHCTFFEMLGNWSLGDYFKEEAISWSKEFLTEVLEIPLDKIAVSVFAGDSDCPKDTLSASIWEKQGIKKENIYYLPKKNNWWGPAGQTGPCGPDTEIFIDTGKEKCCKDCSPACDCGKFVEIWNNVFMEYFKEADGSFSMLKQKNVDTGMGLERTVCILNGYSSVYETDLFAPVIALLCKLSNTEYGKDESRDRAVRIIADHIRTSVFLLGDEKGITPSNTDQGYVLRRLIRRAIRFCRQLNLESGTIEKIALLYIDIYKDTYKELSDNKDKIISELNTEESKFESALQQGIKELEKVLSFSKDGVLNGKTAFRLYDTFGFPLEMTEEICGEKGFKVDREGYKKAEKEHQEKSKAGSEQKFKGGLIDHQKETTNLHTATHLMLASIRKLLGDDIFQKGSNITAERLRFDFNFPRPLTAEEISEIENEVNKAIKDNVEITCEEMSVAEAKQKGALGVFESKYGEKVKVYTIGKYSKEICGGPHAARTGELGRFKIIKEQSSSAGVRRIKAVLITEENK